MKRTLILVVVACVLAGCGVRFSAQQKKILDREVWRSYVNVGNLGVGFVPYHDALHGYHYSLASTNDYEVKWSFIMMDIADELVRLDARYDAKTVVIGQDPGDNTKEIKEETRRQIKEKLLILDVIDPDDVYKIGAPFRDKYGS